MIEPGPSPRTVMLLPVTFHVLVSLYVPAGTYIVPPLAAAAVWAMENAPSDGNTPVGSAPQPITLIGPLPSMITLPVVVDQIGEAPRTTVPIPARAKTQVGAADAGPVPV